MLGAPIITCKRFKEFHKEQQSQYIETFVYLLVLCSNIISEFICFEGLNLTHLESGKIFWKVQRQPAALDSIDCLGKFLQSEDRFGSCTLRQWWGPRHEFSREPMRWYDRPLKDLSCSACQRDCKIYALSFKADGQAQEHQLILAVPGVCTNGDVAFRTVLANTASVNFEWRCF